MSEINMRRFFAVAPRWSIYAIRADFAHEKTEPELAVGEDEGARGRASALDRRARLNRSCHSNSSTWLEASHVDR